jgi:hypothetical protein
MSSRKAVQQQTAIAIPAVQSSEPLFVDIKEAARRLGTSVFAIRNLCWNRDTARRLKPVRHGLKFLFSPTSLTEFAAALVRGEVKFPPTPSKPKSRKAVR